MNTVDQLRALFDEAKKNPGFVSFNNDDGTFRSIHRTTPGSSGSLSLRELQTAAGVATQYGMAIVEHKPVAPIAMSASIAERSRVAQAGAQILVVDPAAEARPVGNESGVLAFAYQRRRFTMIDAAPFVLMPAPTVEVPIPEVSESALPVSRIDVGYNGSTNETFSGPSYAVRFKLTRRQTKDVPMEQMLKELVLSVTMGLAAAADHALLSAVTALPLTAFSLGKAAAAGLTFKQLRALIGTAGTGAAVGQDGALRAAGIAAELTSVVAPTIVGSFASIGLAVHDSLRMRIEQIDIHGDAYVTCFADFHALIPEQAESLFWTAA